MKKAIYLFILILLVGASCSKTETLDFTLKVNFLDDSVYVHPDDVHFSWFVNHPQKEMYQKGYEIILSDNISDMNNNTGNIWESGIIDSDQSHLIQYTGNSLLENETYYWKVRIWLTDNSKSAWSTFHTFNTALKGPWNAQWIGMDLPDATTPVFVRGKKSSGETRQRSVYVRKNAELKDNIRRVTAYTSGLGAYIFYVNGVKAGEDFLTPGWTHYPEKVQYQGYDITSLVKQGANAFGAILGNSWWSSGLGWNGGAFYSNKPVRFTGTIIVEYDNGETEVIYTDQTWKTTLSPIIENTLYHGEIYDANLEINNWNTTEAKIDEWAECIVFDDMNDVEMIIQPMETIQVTEELKPVSVFEPKKGVYVVDFGQNMTGWARIKLQEPAGKRIDLKYAELLHADSTVAQENLRSARAIDTYISAGADGQVEWAPEFTYHGYRYVQIEGLSSPLKPDDIVAEVIHTNIPVEGKFEASNDILTRFFRNTTWGLRSNFMSVPTDCPQRDERLGWMGDAQIVAPTANYIMSLAPMWKKWTHDIMDCQDSTGYTYDVNPAIVVGGPAKPGWGDAITVVPWMSYKFFGDLRIIEESYESAKRWVDYMESESEDYIYEFGDDEWGGYGDWVAVEKSPTKPIGSVYFKYSADIVSNMANLLGKSTDAIYYKNLADSIAIAFQEKYFDKDSLNYPGKTQTANLLPLVTGITPDNLKDDIVQNIVNDVVKKGNHHTTGFLGTAFILPVLSDNGYHELAYKVATQKEYPSWGYMLEKGATTIWELWNSDTEKPEGMNSRNHFAYGSVVEWYFSHLAGIKPEFENPGYKRSSICPMPVDDLDWVDATTQTPYGELAVRWEKQEEKFVLNIQVPFNTTSRVCIPMYTSGNKVLLNGKEIQPDDNKENPSIELGSGEYMMEVIF